MTKFHELPEQPSSSHSCFMFYLCLVSAEWRAPPSLCYCGSFSPPTYKTQNLSGKWRDLTNTACSNVPTVWYCGEVISTMVNDVLHVVTIVTEKRLILSVRNGPTKENCRNEESIVWMILTLRSTCQDLKDHYQIIALLKRNGQE